MVVLVYLSCQEIQGCFEIGHGSIAILQISPTRCTILINIFISLLYMFRESMCPSSGENYCIYATMVFVTLKGGSLNYEGYYSLKIGYCLLYQTAALVLYSFVLMFLY